ncbi:hypothetical protein BDV59DRAFT_201795 [Aspergillus ambiguus]|uniref:BTB/POZ domain-containing protein n=1 Tax=Aspergillus ambiguus TaxID=176160 RepID=UPI003CCC9456
MTDTGQGTKRKALDFLEDLSMKKLGCIAKSFHLSDKYSDLTITCRDKVFPAHRVVVCPQSGYFARACDGASKVKCVVQSSYENEYPLIAKESSGKIEIQDFDPILVEKTLEFLYTGDYIPDLSTYVPPDLGQQPDPSLEPCFHVLMYQQGAYFQIPELKVKAKDTFAKTFLVNPQKRSLVAAIQQVYESTTGWDDLKKLMLQQIVENAKILYKAKSQVIPLKAIKEIPEFATEVAHFSLYRLGNVVEK